MTAAKTVTVIVLDSGGTNELTIYPQRIEEVHNKVLSKITEPIDTAEYTEGPNATLILDLLQVEKRYTVTGFCSSSDVAKLRNVFNAGGVVKFTYQSADQNINFEKLQIVEDTRSEGEQDQTKVVFTALVGEDLLGA